MSKKNVAVTGGSGFIGSELVRQLKVHPYVNKVVVIDIAADSSKEDEYSYDLTKNGFSGIIDDNQIDVVFGLAALIGGIQYFHDHPAEILHWNNVITGNTLESIRKSHSQPHFVYMSSSMVFESADHFPTTEDYIYECPPPLSAYGFSKLVGEYLCEAYNQQYNTEYTIVRAFNAFGCNEYPKEVGIAHVIPDLIKKILDGQGTEDNPLEILGDGEQIRCYTHISDICDGIIAAASIFYKGKLSNVGDLTSYNISSPKPHTVNEVAQLIWNRIKGDQPLYKKYLPALMYDVQKRIPCTTKARDVLGWKAKYTLEDKIDEVIEWVKSVNS